MQTDNSQKSKSSIQDGVEDIRDFVTQRRVQDKLLKNKPLYLQLCSCMDTVSDTQQAIDFYKAKIDDEATNIGELYLQVYGLLQSIFVQQDASIDMANSLSIADNIKNYPVLTKIRNIRSRSIGHPTNYRNGQSFNTIVQHSLSKKSFEIFSYDSGGTHSASTVQILDILKDQEIYIGEILTKIFNEVNKKDSEHKLKFKDMKISECFTKPDVFYCCEKMIEALITSKEYAVPQLGKYGIEGVKSALDNFQNKLAERGVKIDTYPGIEIVFNDCKYPVEKLITYFSDLIGNRPTAIDNKTAEIFAEYVRGKVHELFGMAKEIDEEYSS
jgi:hypothetical protein